MYSCIKGKYVTHLNDIIIIFYIYLFKMVVDPSHCAITINSTGHFFLSSLSTSNRNSPTPPAGVVTMLSKPESLIDWQIVVQQIEVIGCSIISSVSLFTYYYYCTIMTTIIILWYNVHCKFHQCLFL